MATGSLWVEETSADCTVNHRALASSYQLSNMKHPAQDSNRRPQRLEARTLTATPSSPLLHKVVFLRVFVCVADYSNSNEYFFQILIFTCKEPDQ